MKSTSSLHLYLSLNPQDFINSLVKHHPDVMMADPKNPVEGQKLRQFLESKLDMTTFMFVYNFVEKIIDFDATFGDKGSLAFYFLRSQYLKSSIAIRNLVLHENGLESNQGKTWSAVKGNKWTIDPTFRRETVDMVFHALATYEYFERVELHTFVWKKVEKPDTKKKEFDHRALHDVSFDDEEAPPSPSDTWGPDQCTSYPSFESICCESPLSLEPAQRHHHAQEKQQRFRGLSGSSSRIACDDEGTFNSEASL